MGAGTLAGTSALVTGASEGIGRALAIQLAAAGADLVLGARNEERLQSIAEECRRHGREVLALPTDVSREQDCKRLVDEGVARFNGLDALYCNAGRTMWARFDALENLQVFPQLLDVNLMGAVYCTHYALDALRAKRGRIVAVASAAGLTGVPERTAYAATKHALVGFMDSLRIELRDTGVSVTVAAPDFVLTETHRRALGADGKALGNSPMQEGKLLTAERCAQMVIEAAQRRQRLCLTSTRTRLGLLLKPFVPKLLDRIAADAIAKRR
ncbi:MAG: SDR family oxidoreductase [Pseudomonadota bacterium]